MIFLPLFSEAEDLRLAEAFEASEASAARKASEALRQAEEARTPRGQRRVENLGILEGFMGF